MVLVSEEGVWLLWCNWDIFNREKKTITRRVWLAMRGQKMNFKNAICICVCMCIYLYRVYHELRSLLRESVPYVKIY